jgi:hypothetical protein
MVVKLFVVPISNEVLEGLLRVETVASYSLVTTETKCTFMHQGSCALLRQLTRTLTTRGTHVAGSLRTVVKP